MFEAQVVGLLQRYLGKYVYGLDAESLRISVWRGDVELRNLRLKPEALEELNLPITVKAGLLGRLTLRVPWSKLGKEPVVAEFDRLYLVACPREDETKTGVCPSSADTAERAEEIECDAKRRRVNKAEEKWLEEVAAKDVSADAATGNGGGGTGAVGMFRALVDTIIGNLELHITNVHIHYEDTTSNPGHSFCIGIMLQEISGHTANADWERAFVSADALKTLRKSVKLQSLAIYFDCDVPLLEPGKRWDLITRERWDELLLPANHTKGCRSHGDRSMGATSGLLSDTPQIDQQQQLHQFLLCPVDGTLHYLRRGRQARVLETDAEQEIHLKLQSISIRLHQLQYQSGQKLLQEFDTYAASAPYRNLRPQCRPAAGSGARLWWRYAITVVKRQQQNYSSQAWQQLRQVAVNHKQYVPAYVRFLQQGKPASDEKTMADMDKGLDEAVILLFRRMAHAKYKAAKAKSAAAENGKQQQQQQQQTWLGWLMGGGHKAQQQEAKHPAAAATAGADEQTQDLSLGVEEWNKLEDILSQQAAALGEDQQDTGTTVKSIMTVKVDVAAMELQESSGRLIMQAAMGGVDSQIVAYPKTQDITFSVFKFGVTSSHGPLMSSGVIMTDRKTAVTASSATGAAAPGSGPGGGKAMSLRLLRNPQDGSADLLVQLAVAPSYVTYDKTAIQDVMEFFKSEEALELSRLQAQAAARTDKLRRMAQLQLKALSQRNLQQRAQMRLFMTLHAPKVAVPDATGRSTLIADLGCFTVRTNTQASETLSQEEAAIYEAFVVKVDHVSAYLLDGPFAWPTTDELIAASAVAETDVQAAPGVFASSQQQQPAVAVTVLQGLLAKRARVVPLLDRFGLGVDLQVATSVHPRYPVLRLAVSASPLKLHLSPYRYQQLMMVVQSVASPPPAQEGQDTATASQAAAASADKPLWMSEAEYMTKVSLLAWEGMGGRAAKWQSHRWLHVWRGRLYLTPHKEDPEICLSRNYWLNYRVVALPPEVVGGSDNVLAVIPKSVKIEAVTESPDAVIIRAPDAVTGKELRKRLMASANQMAAVAGLLELGDAEDDDAAVGTTKDVFDELFSHQLLLQLYGSISEVSLLVGGRAPVSWWPPPELDTIPSSSSLTHTLGSFSTPASAGGAAMVETGTRGASSQPASTSAASAALTAVNDVAAGSSTNEPSVLVPLEEEVDLVAIKFQGAQVGVTMGGDGFVTEVAMAALTVDDLLVGEKNPEKAHMARSSIDWDKQQQQQQSAEMQATPPGQADQPAPGLNDQGHQGHPQSPPVAATAADTANQAPPDSPSDSHPPSRSNTEDEEFFDAEEGDSAAPRVGRRRLSSGSSSSLTSGAALSTVIGVDDADANNAQLAATRFTGMPPAAAALAASAAAAGQPVHSALQLLEGFGLDVDDASFIAAPSFVSAMRSFTAASGSAGWDTVDAASSKSSNGSAHISADTAREDEQELVRLRFAQYSPNSNNYSGLDVEVMLKLSTLVFYCNRPTVAAIMVFGTDLGAINTLLSSQKEADGGDAAPSAETATTDSESMSDIQLVRGGGEQRTLFKLTLQVAKVALHLNYEGDVATPLAVGSIDNFTLQLAVHPTTLQLDTSLGNLVAEYGSLPVGHPNRVMVSMRDKQAGSLIEVTFKMHSVEESFMEQRVPGGMQYMSVVTHLSTVQIIFMNKFLVEFLDYLAAMLAMQAKPKEQPELPEHSQQPQQLQLQQQTSQQASGAATSPTSDKPLVLLLDVELDAPVLVLPLASSSEDHLEVDLGTLQLSNRIVWQMRTEDKQKLLVDEMEVQLQKVSGCVVNNNTRGRNIIREMGDGVTVFIRRALMADPLPIPPVTTAVTVPKLRASLLDTEYALILAVLSGNFSEAADIPRSIAWLHQQLLPDHLVAAAAVGAGGVAVTAAANSIASNLPASNTTAAARPGVSADASTGQASDIELKKSVVSDFTCTNASLLGLLCDLPTVKTTVSIQQAQLMLWNAQPQGLPPAAVGSIEFSNMWVAVNITQAGSMLLSLSIPSVCARDLRAGVPKEASLVLSTAEIGASTAASASLAGTGAIPLPTGCPKDRAAPAGGTADTSSCEQRDSCSSSSASNLLPSLLTLEYRQVKGLDPEPVSALQVRLQRPTLVLDVGFIMKVLHFVAPTAGLQGPVPRPYETREIHLGPEPYLAADHLWLSPEYRIIADAPGFAEAVYDGAGHALVLPDSVPAVEHVPLLVVGRGKTLRLKNVRIINRQALAGVLQLGPGARLIADDKDGVTWHDAEELARLRNKHGRHVFGKSARMHQASQQNQLQQQLQPSAAGSINISVHAVGAAVYLIDAHAAPTESALQDVQYDGVIESADVPPSEDQQEYGGGSDDVSLNVPGVVESIRRSSAGAHAEVQKAGQSEMLKMLAMYLDLGLDIVTQGDNSDISAQLQGLCIKAQARMLEDAAEAATDDISQGGGADADSQRCHIRPASSHEVATGILEPCDVKLVVKQSAAVQDYNIDISALQLRLSPDVMQLLMHLQQVVLEPLAVPAASQPLARVDKFSYLWCSHEASGASATAYSAAGAGGVDLLGSDKGVTVWRPQPPTGYAIVGDVLSAGHSQPDHQVIAIAINSGLVIYPTGYTLVWESSGISFWRPVAPPGYVAMGCVASLAAGKDSPDAVRRQTSSGAVPPSRKACVVVAKQVAVEALLAECMMLCTNGNLWCIQNSAGTFEVAPPEVHQPQVAVYDLRSPLGIAPYALTPIQQHAGPAHAAGGQTSSLIPRGSTPFSYLALPPSLKAAEAFAANRAALRAKVASSGQVTTTVEFGRIWWDKHAKHPSMTKVSFWRPVPPPGYVKLGDCMVAGLYCPPQSVLVVRDADPSEKTTGQPPLLARPLRCTQVWVDGHKKARGDTNYLTLWKLIAPAGYVAMGLLASLGERTPNLEEVRCVRADMATRVDLQPSDPALIFYPYKQRPGMGAWVADDRAATFVAVSHDGSQQVLEAFRLKDVDQQQKGKADGGAAGVVAGQRAVQLSLSAGKANLLLRNLLRTPILELEAANLNVGLSQEVCGVQRCFAYLTTSLWSYHQSLEVWEPIMEPWQLLLHMDTNPNTFSSAGIAPGTWVRLTSPQGSMHVTLAQAPLVYALDALTDWQGMVDGVQAKKEGLAAADGMTVYTTVNNTLGVPAYFQLDYGEGHKEVVMLRPHAVTSVTQPMPVPPVSHAPLTAGPPPPMRLVVDVLDGILSAGLTAAGSVPELYVKVDVVGKLHKQLAEATQGMVTRAVAAHVTLVPSAQASLQAQQGTEVVAGQILRWNERFVLALPAELAEQLLTPAPGDNPFEGVALELMITVCDGSGERGLGRIISKSVLQIKYSWLLGQVQALLGLRQAAAGATSVGTAAAGHKRALSGVAAGAAAAAAQLGAVYDLSLKDSSGSQAAGDPSGDQSSSGVDDDTIMHLKVAVSLDDSQVNSSWYPHQRMRRHLARLLGIASSPTDSLRKVSAAGSLARPGSSSRQVGGLVAAAGGQKHALRLEGSDVWSPFSYTSLRRLAGSATGPHTGIVPIRAGQGLVLELSYTGGQYSARIRSLCQFFNNTDMVLEVALLEEDDSSWTVLPSTATAGGSSSAPGQKRPAVGDVMEEEVFEYERYLPLRGWSADYLKGLDPHRYSRNRDGSRGSTTFPKVPLPPGWEWEGPWEVEVHGNVDPDGWAYAFEPRQFRWPPETGAGIKKAHDFVRRRRLVRKRRRVALPTSVLDVSAAGQSTGGNAATAAGEQWQRRALGCVEPGGSLPLPQDWRTDNKQLQIRPALPQGSVAPQAADNNSVPSHAWSYGVSNGQHSVQLASMEDGASRLLCCKTLGQSPAKSDRAGDPEDTVANSRTAAAAAPACWFSTTCEATELVLQGGMDVLTDWSVVAQPPLTLRNDLPVAAHYVLWERPARGGTLVLRQQGHLEGGASIDVYSVDMRQQVCLTFHPEGCEWAEREPVVISEGFLGSTAGVESSTAQLPDSFCIRYSNSHSTNALLRIALNRHMDTELLDSQRIRAATARAAAAGGSTSAAAAALADTSAEPWRMSYGAALAQGRPLVLALSVPVWVVNGTQLPIAVGIVQIATSSNGDNGSGVPTSGDILTGDGALDSSGQLRVLDTEAYTQVMRPSSSVTIMGNSVELLSYPGEGPDGSGSTDQPGGGLRAAANITGPTDAVVKQWAAVISIMGSRWSSPVVLAAAGAAGGIPGAAPNSAPVAEAVARQLRYDPVVIRARCKDNCVYDVTVRIESAGTGLPLSTVVRLDPHLVVSNRTGYTLQLLQPEPIQRALGMPVPVAGASSLSTITSSSSGQQAAWIASSTASDQGARQRKPVTPGTVAPVRDATMVLRPGSLAVPLSWPQGCDKRTLSITLPASGSSLGGRGSAGGSDSMESVDPVMWSDVFKVEYPATGVMQVLLPLYKLGIRQSPEQPQLLTAQKVAAAHQAFKALFQPAQQAAAPGKPPLAPPSRQSQADASQEADNGPLLIHLAKKIPAGLLEYLAVTVNILVEMPTPGCLHLILQSLGGEPQHCLMNCTSVPISYRPNSSGAVWQLLPPYSGAALVLLHPAGGPAGNGSDSMPSCSEVQLSGDPESCGFVTCSLETDTSGIAVAQTAGRRSGGGSAGRSSGQGTPSVFPVAGGSAQAIAQVLPIQESVMAPAGPAEVPGAGSVSVGRTQTDRLLRVLPKTGTVSMNQLRLAACIAGQDQARLSPAFALHLSLELPSLDLSMVDGRPQELMLLSLDGLAVEYHAGNSAGITYNQLLVRVNLAQLDDMLQTTPFPVLLVPADKTVLEDSAADPLIFFTYVSQPSRLRGALFTPTIAGRVAALRIQLSETLAWRLFAYVQGLMASGSGSASGVASGATTASTESGVAGLGSSTYKASAGSRDRLSAAASSGNLAASAAGAAGSSTGGAPSGTSGVQQVASADLPLQVDLLSLDDLPLRVSFRTDKSTRPRWANQMWIFNTLGDMLNFDDLQLTLPGLELAGKYARSALIGHGLKQLQAQALAIVFNVFRSYGVLGTATKLLAVGSNITSAITGTSTGALGAGAGSTERVGNIGQGFIEGGKTFGEGLLKGVTGVVADPLAGAKQGGVLGFMTGTVRGLVGVPGQIIGGALSAASKVTEGMDATYKEVKGQLTSADQLVVQRRRLPRCIRGDGILTSYSPIPAMGLGLLYNCGAGSVDSLVKGTTASFLRSSNRARGKQTLTDSYETHMTLPGGNVAMITNMRLLMIQAEAFAALEAEVEASGRHQVNAVPSGRLLWQLTWDQMLSAELAYHRQQPGAPPDGVIVHRKFRSEDGDVLVHDVRCNPNDNQALRFYEALSAARLKYYIQPRREATGWKVTPVIAAEQQDNQEMPDVMLSMDFKRVWRSSRPGARPLSVWRPVGPPGYAPLGDVAMPGNEPPARPVSMYRDVAHELANQDPAAGLSGLPALALPERYQLVFRDSGGNTAGSTSAMSLWRPIPPNGYLEVGYVVVPAIEEPPLGIVRCMRSDLLKQGRLFDYPVWSDTSSDNLYWQCSMWQVDNSCSTFVAVKSSNKPHPHVARAPLY